MMKLQNIRCSTVNYCCIIIISLILLLSCNNNGDSANEIFPNENISKVDELLDKENPLYSLNSEATVSYNNQAIELSKKIGYEKGVVVGTLNLGRVQLGLNNLEKAKAFFQSALDYAENESVNDQIPTCLGLLGTVYEKEFNYPLSLDYYARSKEAFSNNRDTVGIINCYINTSNIYRDIGDRVKAMNAILKGLELAEKSNNDHKIGTCLNNLSIIYQENGENNLALPYFQRFAEICINTGDSLGLARAYNNIGVAYLDLDNNELALEFYKKSATIREKLNDRLGLASNFLNMGNLLSDQREFSAALNYYEEALEISKNHKDFFLICKLNKIIADVLVESNKYDSAIYYLSESLNIAEKYNLNERSFAALNALTNVYEKRGDFENAFRYSKAAMAANDTLIQLQNNEVVEELKTRYETENKEQEIIKLNDEKEYAKQIRILLIGISGLLLILAIYIFFSQRLKIRKNKQINNYQQSLMERKLTISKLEQNNLEQNLKHSEKELVNMALYLVQKIEFVEKLKKEIKLMQKDKSNAKEEIAKKVTQLINNNLRLDKEHVDFQLHLENVNQLFYKKLKESYPSVTQNELKLSALLRCDFSSKDIAIIFNISPSSVDMNRYRLRKKFNLAQNDNLNEFLKNL